MEADDNELDDVQADLPKVGKRLRYFTLTATRLSGQVLKVRLTSHGCQVEATNPDLETRGIISDIEAVADRCRRVPRWLCPLSPAGGSNAAAAAVLIAVFGGIYSVVAGVSAYDHFALSGNHGVSWPASIISCILSTIITLSIVSMQFRARTLLFTGTNADAPTWWQEYRGHLGIAIIS